MEYIQKWKMALGGAAILLCLGTFYDKNGLCGDFAADKLTLSSAVMSEDVQDHQPLNEGVVFSIGIGRVFCYTRFDVVPEKTYITHNWYNRDNLSTKIKLPLQPPRWTTYSAIQLRESDKGPWRVEVTDSGGRILQVLRFSVTE
ncbi:MAG: DUF2914 domain-containing protein [Deltaproteobacteria bacterium]|nr:DUF2914 domain-containing protein [Deltaproteobacteria bacterium]